jgi:Purple acid Phosphatase, N-terminal domain
MPRKLAILTFLLFISCFAWAQADPQATSEDQNQNAPVQITQAPRVEAVTTNTATIAWSTNVQAGTRLVYGTDPKQLAQTASAPWGGVTHRVYLNNLQPNTTYYFQAYSEHASGTGTSVTSGMAKFTTVNQ